MAIIVDFTGLAGAGKSYVCQQIKEQLEREGVSVHVASEMRLGFIFLLCGLPLLLRSFIFALGCRPASLRCVFSSAMAWFKMQMKFRYFRSFKGVALVDEGYLHKFRQVRRCGRDTLLLSDVYSDYFLEPDFTVIVEADAETITARRGKRDGLAFAVDAIQKALSRMRFTYSDAATLSRENPAFGFCVVDNSAGCDIALNVSSIKDALMARLALSCYSSN
jgi:thymidylate kinase